MGKKEPAGYSINVQDTLLQMAGEDPQLAAKLVQIAEPHEARVAAMTPEEREELRLKEEAILAEEREGLRAWSMRKKRWRKSLSVSIS